MGRLQDELATTTSEPPFLLDATGT